MMTSAFSFALRVTSGIKSPQTTEPVTFDYFIHREKPKAPPDLERLAEYFISYLPERCTR